MPRILVIDDSLSTLQVMGTMLTQAGYETRTCSEAKHALAALKSEAFDLIVTDIYMPDMDGIEVIQEGQTLRRKIPIIAVSGVIGRMNMLPAAKLLGACQTLQKPFSQAHLLTAVADALGITPSKPPKAAAATVPPPTAEPGRPTAAATGSLPAIP